MTSQLTRRLLSALLPILLLVAPGVSAVQSSPPTKDINVVGQKSGPEPPSCKLRVFLQKGSAQVSERGAFYDEEIQWWESAGQKSFPQVCRAHSKEAAEFIFIWSSGERREERFVPTPSVMGQDISERGVPIPSPERRQGSVSLKPPSDFYVVQEARIEVFEVRDGVVLSKSLFKTATKNEKKVSSFGGHLPLRFLTDSLFQHAVKFLIKRAEKQARK